MILSKLHNVIRPLIVQKFWEDVQPALCIMSSFTLPATLPCDDMSLQHNYCYTVQKKYELSMQKLPALYV